MTNASVIDAPPAALRRDRARLLRRHPYAGLFVLAFLVRAAVALGVFIVFGGSLILDDATHADLARQVAVGDTSDWDPYMSWYFTRTGTLLWPLAAIYRITGPSLLLAQLFVAAFGALTAVAAARLAAEVLNRRGAMITGGLVALWPSQVLFSSLVTKDAQVWFLLTAVALLLAWAARASTRRTVILFLAVAVALVLLSFLRLHTMTVAMWGIPFAACVGSKTTRIPRLAMAGVLLVALPWLLGIGPGGVGLIVPRFNDVAEIRTAQAYGGSAIAAAGKPRAGGAATNGDPSDSASESDDSAVAMNLGYLPRGLVAVLTEPWPWRLQGSPALRLAQGENLLLWYPLLALAVVGVLRAWRHRAVLMYPVVVGGAIVLMWSLAEGNIGTAYRHRGEFTWVVCLLAVTAIPTVATWLPRLTVLGIRDRSVAELGAPDEERRPDKAA